MKEGLQPCALSNPTCRHLEITGAGKSSKAVFMSGDELSGVKMGYMFTLERQQVSAAAHVR